jgi:Raf kinase inhibitor-like YbhB/YbcL family protein
MFDPYQSFRNGEAALNTHCSREGRAMQLTSTAFANNGTIPRRHTCDGEDVSPPLAWSDAPAGARSFVLLCDDPDAPGGTWHHWAAYDIRASQTALVSDAARHADGYGFKQGTNDFDRIGYGGPCPPHRHGPHHYHFRLMALSVEHLPVRKSARCREVEREARKHVLAEAALVGIYER